MSKIWIDLTELATYPKLHTGIQRVVYNLAKLYRKDSQAKFIYFDFDFNIFRFFDFENYIIQYEKKYLINTQSFDNDNDKNNYLNQLKKGISPFYLELYKILISSKLRLKITPKLKKIIYFLIHFNKYFKRLHINILKLINIFIKFENYFAKKLLNQIETEDVFLEMGRFWEGDLINKIIELKYKKSFQLNFVIYDLIPIFQIQAFDEKLYKIFTKSLFEAIQHSVTLYCVSNSTKKDLLKFIELCVLPIPKIKVLRSGDELDPKINSIKPIRIAGVVEYLLVVGKVEILKNHQILYYVWKEALYRNIKLPKLLIVGNKGLHIKVFDHSIKYDKEIYKEFIFLENTNESELKWLYQNSLFTIYPSYYEGWGLPVAEALALGKLCITTNVSSMPEIAKELTPLVSQYDTNAIL